MKACRDDLTARSRLRDAALRLFAERGVDEVGVREIAAAAGVSHGLVRHHFEDKEGLVAAVNDHAVATLREVLATASAVDPRVAGPERTASIAIRRRQALEQVSAAQPDLARYVARRVTQPDPGGRELFAALADALANDLGTLREDGVLRDDADVQMVAGQLLALELGGLLMRDALAAWLGAEVTERWWDSLEHLLERGLYRPAPEG